MNTQILSRHLDAYLALRDALGLATRVARKLLPEFVRYLHTHSAEGPIRAHLAIDWACETSATRGASGQATRLTVARGFLTHLKASLPDTEIPPYSLLAAPRRAYPYLFSPTDISRILAAAACLPPPDSLRPHTYQTVFGLLASTGLRPGEAVKLRVSDVQLEECPPRLLIWQTKFRKSRWVPLHPTVVVQLRQYAHRRRELYYDGLADAFFISEQGRPLTFDSLDWTFRRLVRRLALYTQPGHRAPSLMSFRHTFAVNRLRQWYEAGIDVRAQLPHLSVYLGHLDPTSSYWYLSATPELLGAAALRFAQYSGKGGDA